MQTIPGISRQEAVRETMATTPTPIHMAATPLGVELQSTAGTVHDPETDVNLSPEATYPDQFWLTVLRVRAASDFRAFSWL